MNAMGNIVASGNVKVELPFKVESFSEDDGPFTILIKPGKYDYRILDVNGFKPRQLNVDGEWIDVCGQCADLEAKLKDFEQFKSLVADSVKDFLPEAYKDAEVRHISVTKVNDQVFDGLVVKKPGDNIGVNVYLNFYYDKFGLEHFVEAAEAVARQILMNEDHKKYTGSQYSVSDITDWDKVKKNLSFRLINRDLNKGYLTDKVYSSMLDLAIVYEIKLYDNAGHGRATISVNQGLFDSWGISIEEMHAQAVENISQQAQAFSMEDIIRQLFIEKMISEGCPEEEAELMAEDYLQMMKCEGPQMYVVSTKSKTYGAGVIICDPFMDQLAERFGDMYIIPSSIHECLVLPQEGVDPESLKPMVTNVNGTVLRDEEILSDKIYKYKKQTHTLYIVD